MVRTWCSSLPRTQVQSLVGELKPQKLCSAAGKKKNQKKKKKKKTLNTKPNTTRKILDKIIMLSVEELLVNQILVSYLYEHTHVYIYT